jgi:hypothetical protein
MGLNWSEGLTQAAEGMEGLMGVQQNKTDILYKELSSQNRMRFEAEQAQLGRDFQGDQYEADRVFRADEAGKRRDWETGEKVLDRQQRDRQFDIEQQFNELIQEQNNLYRQLTLQQGERELELRKDTAGTAQIVSEERLSQDRIAAIREYHQQIRESMEYKYDMSDEEKALVIRRESDLVKGAKLDTSRQASFDSAYEMLGGAQNQYAADLAVKYAKLTPEQQSEVTDQAKVYEQDASMTRRKAFGASIQEYEPKSKPKEGSEQIPDPKQGSNFIEPPAGAPEVSSAPQEKGWLHTPIKDIVSGAVSESNASIANTVEKRKAILEIADRMAQERGMGKDWHNTNSAKRDEVLAAAAKEYEANISGGTEFIGSEVAWTPPTRAPQPDLP